MARADSPLTSGPIAGIAPGARRERVGALMPGLAHDIGTPLQYIDDSIRFVERALPAMNGLLEVYRAALGELVIPAATAATIARAERTADVAFLLTALPSAVERALEGTSRLAALTAAMATVGRVDDEPLVVDDPSRHLRTALLLTQHELKYLATIELDLDEGALAVCRPRELVLALVDVLLDVAAAFAAAAAGTGTLGALRIRSCRDGDGVVIAISAAGIALGASTGGAVSRAIVDRHHGALTIVGDTVRLRLPAWMPSTPMPPATS